VGVVDAVEEAEESRRLTVEIIEVAVDMGADSSENFTRRRTEEKEGYIGVGVEGILGWVEETLPLDFEMGNIMRRGPVETTGEADEVDEVAAAADRYYGRKVAR
jgi:hypothetical protein